MAAAVSPTPFALHSGARETRRPLNRMLLRDGNARPLPHRPSSEGINFQRSYIQAANDSSDDEEDLAPVKLSAEAQAILGEDNSNAALGEEYAASRPDVNRDEHGSRTNQVVSTVQRSPQRNDGSPAPRVIHMKGSRPSPRTTLARDGSFMYKRLEKSTTADAEIGTTAKTPATQIRRIHLSGSRSQTRSPPPTTADGSNNKSGQAFTSPGEDERSATPEAKSGPGPSTISRSRRTEEHGVHSTMRVRRIGTGTLLNGPIRRGMIRRQSDEDEDQLEYKANTPDTPEIEQGRREAEPHLQDLPDNGPNLYDSIKKEYRGDSQYFETAQEKMSTRQADVPASRQPPSPSPSPSPSRPASGVNSRSRPTPASISYPPPKSHSSNRKPIFRIPSLPPLESTQDQENEPPPTFKKSKPSMDVLEVRNDDMEPAQKPLPQNKSKISPSRPPLATRTNNTPHRPAPAPPPKMSLIEAATSSAGNARSKKSVHYVLNGRTYRRLDMIGRGGSSRVFRIMAENFKIFALKRVNLEEADMAAIAGYKGEIDLLRKLSNVDRVIRLFDYEVNEDKGVLSVMMELGESDFSKMLNEQLKGENAKLDITFTRHYWKEMLECVQAVHNHDIVHSDLKPANFLLVKGQLKLIDFGIANAIQDNTVNVHRENQIGTPNYMSPESLVAHTPAAGTNPGPKILKLGKPSDVWSLGCILYQMTYGQPPFAHIAKAFERIMSIPNPKVEIQFPTTGIGGAVVPFGLIRTLRRCLQRDQTLRPTIAELLSEDDPFLNPVAISPEMLGRVIGNVVGYCRKREESMRQAGTLGKDGQSCLPKDEEMMGWPLAFYKKLRQAQEEGSAW